MNEIKILHGPYQVSEVWSHRPKRLFTLREHLNCLGFLVELEPIQPRNRLIITLNGFEIFRCSLVYLNSLTVNDPKHKPNILLKNIIWAAIEARARFSSAKMALLGKEIPRECDCTATQCYCFLKGFRK